jgi:transcriptional regulator with XRE-family HTH domain
VPKPKIDRIKLRQLLRAGKSQTDIAKYFGVTESAISQAKKELNVAVVKNVALENAHEIVNREINALDQLGLINNHANELLDILMRWNRGEDQALQVLENQVRKVRIGKEEIDVREVRLKDTRELALKAMAEIRGQLHLQLDIFQSLYDMQAVQEFQQEVLDAIGEIDGDTKGKIIQRLAQRRAIRTLIK